ncbi:MAG TPA: thioredoxin family protein [Polyangiales bacterium]|nr:thioredoxin family protein [Polyangiales bacterium]
MVAYSNGMAVGTAAPAFDLPGVDGRSHSLASFSDARALVVIFTCNHCPYAKAVEERLVALQRDYLARGVRLCAINPNDEQAYPDDSFAAMVERAQLKGFNFPYLRDQSQTVARAYDAACTPDIFLFGPERDASAAERAAGDATVTGRKLIYNGRLDDNWQQPDKVQRHDLRRALDLTLESRPLDFDPVPSMGCSIKWKRA